MDHIVKGVMGLACSEVEIKCGQKYILHSELKRKWRTWLYYIGRATVWDGFKHSLKMSGASSPVGNLCWGTLMFWAWSGFSMK